MGLGFVQTDTLSTIGPGNDGWIYDALLKVACTGITKNGNSPAGRTAEIGGTPGTASISVPIKKGADGISVVTVGPPGDYEWPAGGYNVPFHVWSTAFNKAIYLEAVYVCLVRAETSIALVGANVCHTLIPANTVDTVFWTLVSGAAQGAAQADDRPYFCYRLKGYVLDGGTWTIKHGQTIATPLELKEAGGRLVNARILPPRRIGGWLAG